MMMVPGKKLLVGALRAIIIYYIMTERSAAALIGHHPLQAHACRDGFRKWSSVVIYLLRERTLVAHEIDGHEAAANRKPAPWFDL